MHINFLHKYYFINKFDTNLVDKQYKSTNIIYRNYEDKHDEIQIKRFRDYCKKRGHKFFLSNNFELSVKLRLDGAYIPSFNKNLNHLSYSLRKDFLILGSAHNLKEIRIKHTQNVKVLFISSLFKKNKNFLGINKFKLLSKLINQKIVCLGGISDENIKKLKLLKISGFAGKSYFQKKRPLN